MIKEHRYLQQSIFWPLSINHRLIANRNESEHLGGGVARKESSGEPRSSQKFDRIYSKLRLDLKNFFFDSL